MPIPVQIFGAVVVFFLGASVFSFINVVICRVPEKRSFVRGRSACPACGHTLGAADLVPVVSWLCLRGKCRYCGAPIPARDTAVEAFGGALALACIYFLSNDPFRALTIFALAAVLTAVAFIDLDTMEIPDGLVIAAAVIGVISIFTMPGLTLVARLIGALSVSVPMFLLTMAIPGAFGGGDMKLMAACGILLGWKLSLVALLFAVLTGGAQGAVLLATGRARRGDHFAFGPHLCLGILLSLTFGGAVLRWYLGLLGA